MNFRYITPFIVHDLQYKMVWMGGPKSAGKAMLAQALRQQYFQHTNYFNWDNTQDRKAIRAEKWPIDADLIIFDELHKYPHWKGWIKGIYDTKTAHVQFMLITGHF